MKAWFVAGALAAAAVGPSLAGAQASQAEAAPAGAGEAEQQRLEALIAKELGSAAAPAEGAAPAPATSGASPYARLLAMPDLSAVVSFAAAWNDYDVGALSPRSGPFAPSDSLAFLLQEVELSLRSVIDPYARAELYLAVGPDGAGVEEAFLVTTALPAGLQLKAGQLRAPFGRLNAQHPHAWDFVDAPLPLGRLVAEEALAGPGLDLSWLAPLPWFAELHVAAQSTAPFDGDPGRVTGLARLSQFLPLGEETTLGVGLSGGLRDEGAGGHRTLGGADLFLRWRPPAARRALTLQAELVGSRARDGERARWGGYAQLFWRAGPSAGLGLRYDEAPEDGGTAQERRYGAVATWFLSEFQRLRLQVGQDRRDGGQVGYEALLQAEFGIGAHGAHPF